MQIQTKRKIICKKCKKFLNCYVIDLFIKNDYDGGQFSPIYCKKCVGGNKNEK